MKEVVKSYAKINLHLAIGDVRADNFHSIQSIFAKIDLYDILKIDATLSDEISINVKGLEKYNIVGEDTVTKAIRLWCEKSQVKLKVVIEIDKRIPVQAGLGGGSSNAAAALIAINKMSETVKLNNSQLLDIALEVGSDVPFFLYDTTFAYVEGRGECVYPLKANFNYNINLVKPKQGVSTKGAFSKIDKLNRKPFIAKEDLINSFYLGVEEWKNSFYNDFEKVIESEVLKELRNYKDCFTLMSGSGSTCYSICNNINSCYNKTPFSKIFKDKNNTFSCFFPNI